MFLRYNFTDLESGIVSPCFNTITSVRFDPDTRCSIITTGDNQRLYLDTDDLSRHDAFIEAISLAATTKVDFINLQGTVVSLPDASRNDYQEYYEAALDLFEDCRGYILFCGAHSYTF